MRVKPDVLTLLDLTAETLRGTIASALSGRSRYEALLVVSAIEVARREIALGAAHDSANHSDLATLLPSPGSHPDEDLVLAIHRGDFDDDESTTQLTDVLRKITERGLRETNPAALSAEKRSSI